AVVGVALTPARREPALALARLLAEAGEREPALAQVERVLEVDYAFAPARELRQQLQADLDLTPETTRAPGRTSGAAAAAAQERYAIVTELGRGGMGVVYRAWDRRLEREVAIKVLRTTSPKDLARLEEEARAAATLSHPGIVVVHDFDAGFGGYFIAMEYIEGQPLDRILRQDPEVVRRDLLGILRQVAQAVAYAHSRHVVHRDLKPGNILLTSGGTTKIHDFGIATRLAAGGPSGGACGTPFYMAPEQVRGEAATPATDVYCLGATFFHLATGRPPFPRGNIITAHLEQPPPRPDRLVPDLPPGLAELILRCLEKDPRERFPNAAELAGALDVLHR
ncbi:MAG: serine/threonine-protein kinase, partial [Candidatus Krumholzibacteriia bacterium]